MRWSPVALFLIVALVGCGDDDGGTSPVQPTSTVAVIENTSAPTHVYAVPASDPAYAWQISWTIDARETAGVSARVVLLQVAIADRQVLLWNGSQVAAAIGSNSIPANGLLRLPMVLAYNLPTGGKAANVTSTITCVDANNNTVVSSSMLRIYE